MLDDQKNIEDWRNVVSFAPYPNLKACIEFVIGALPHEAEESFRKSNLRITLDKYEPGNGRTVHVAAPGPEGISQCVVLKPRLDRCSQPFVRYIVAHELAHAMLNNGGWGEIHDREEAADALAASWGFSKQPYE